jgi:hypothetical protein
MLTFTMVELLAAASEDKPVAGWAVLVAAVPALVTLIGTLWQVRAHRPADIDASADWPEALSVRIERLQTKRPATTVHPVLARRLVFWHVAVAVLFLALLPVWRFTFLAVLAALYLVGAAYYAWTYQRDHTADLESSAHLLVEGEVAALNERLKESLVRLGAHLEAFDFTDADHSTLTARVTEARLEISVTPAPPGHYEVAVSSRAVRLLDGFPRATQLIDDFIRAFRP